MKKEAKTANKEFKIKVTKNGPYLLSGKIPLSKQHIIPDKDGTPEKWKEGEKFDVSENCALCRCGKAKNKPFCDGTHVKIKFDGTETASTSEKYADNAEEIEGPELILHDNGQFCIGAGFCHRKGGTWDLTKKSNIKECRDTAIQEACNCPSGRLLALDKKTKKPFENVFKPSIGIIEHPNEEISGPLWVRGGIPVESCEGKEYEKRNRATLCRCGKSKNKPFCDGTHIDIGFSDKE